MSPTRIFSNSTKHHVELKVHQLKKTTLKLMQIAFCCAGIMSLTLHAQGTNPSGTGTSANPPAAPIAAATPAAAPAASNTAGFDISKVPPVTPMPRPGLFMLPPTGPGYFSFWDLITNNKREKPPVAPHVPFGLMPTSASDIDFRYLATPGHEKDIFDPIKRIQLGDDWLLSLGGSFWYRYTHETDSRLNKADINNDFHMLRTRINADLWYRDRARLFAEFIDARTFGSELTPLITDRNHADMLNLFTDIKLANVNNGPVYVRVGRQELLYGSQRLISTLDWVNTRRTFQGVKTFWRTPEWDLDAFWVRPMIIEKGNVDNWDTQQNFFGLWATNRPKPGHLIDLYFLSLENERNITPAVLKQGSFLQVDSHTHTIGGRLVGNVDNFLYEIEGMYQFGRRQGRDVSAFAAATGLGYRLPLPMNPQGWIRYDFASGDNGQGGNNNTFNQLFPFGHYYMGFIDRVGRQNIHDINAQFTLHPMHWITFITQYHRFYLANNRDYLYNASGFATYHDATGQSGSHVGDELDFRLNLHVKRHHDVLLGYSKLWAGNFLQRQAPGVNPDLFYIQYNFRF